MIGFNKAIKDGSMIVTDWEILQPGHGYYTSYKTISFRSGLRPYNGFSGVTNTVLNGGQEGWTFASLTQEELDTIMAQETPLDLPAGTFPNVYDILSPVRTDDDDGDGFNLRFDKTSVCREEYYNDNATTTNDTQLINKFKTNWEVNNGKWVVKETAVPEGKEHITHLVFVRGYNSNGATGAMTIQTNQFAAFTVGQPGSGAEIIMNDTSISTGKAILIGDSPKTTIDLKFNTNLSI